MEFLHYPLNEPLFDKIRRHLIVERLFNHSRDHA